MKSKGDKSEFDWWYEQQGIKTFILESGKTIKISEILNKGYIEWQRALARKLSYLTEWHNSDEEKWWKDKLLQRIGCYRQLGLPTSWYREEESQI